MVQRKSLAFAQQRDRRLTCRLQALQLTCGYSGYVAAMHLFIVATWQIVRIVLWLQTTKHNSHQMLFREEQ